MLDPALIIWGIVFVVMLIVWRVEYKYFTKLEKKQRDEALIKLAEEMYRAKVKEEEAHDE